jgi:hypothetical protein
MRAVLHQMRRVVCSRCDRPRPKRAQGTVSRCLAGRLRRPGTTLPSSPLKMGSPRCSRSSASSSAPPTCRSRGRTAYPARVLDLVDLSGTLVRDEGDHPGGGLAVGGLAVGIANDQLQRPLVAGGLWSPAGSGSSRSTLPSWARSLAFALAVALGAWLRRALPAAGAALASIIVLFVTSGGQYGPSAPPAAPPDRRSICLAVAGSSSPATFTAFRTTRPANTGPCSSTC